MWKKLDKDINLIDSQVTKRSNEYASYIIDAVINNNSTTIYGNIMNNKLIDNLPFNCCVEVPCLIDSEGCNPQKVGLLPEHLAGLMRTNINVQLLSIVELIKPVLKKNEKKQAR